MKKMPYERHASGRKIGDVPLSLLRHDFRPRLPALRLSAAGEIKMMTIGRNRSKGFSALLLAFAMFVMPLLALGQTRIEMPKNKYSVSQDVQLGREAAQQVSQQMPILRDNTVDSYVESVGRRLVEAIPAEYQHPEFRYSFDV